MENNNREDFIKSNIPLVHSLCKRFSGKGIEYDDLFGTGCMGLVKAVDNFKPELGFSFSTYAVPVILGELRRLFRDGGSVKVSRSVKELFVKIQSAKESLSKSLQREPTVSEIAEHLGVTAEEVCFSLDALRPVVSLTDNSDSGDTKQLDIKEPEGTDDILNKITIENAMLKLEKDEAEIIRLRYFKFLTQTEAARRLNMTQVQISRKERKILLKMRSIIGSAS